ncbi:MAG TPA: transglutaminase family protein [Pirellulales bacterium]|nr:transglutaminase family protein [Pirellulales bacterium]
MRSLTPGRITLRSFAPTAMVILLWFAPALPAAAQFDQGSSSNSPPGANAPKTDQSETSKIQFGVKVKAIGGACRGIVATIPVPLDWPEQKVSVDSEDISPGVHEMNYRTLQGGAKQMIVTIPVLNAGEEAHALVTFEVTRSSVLPPDDTSVYKECPKDKLPKDVLQYLMPSPYIESTHPKIVALAKDTTEGKTDWEKVEALYDITREKIKYKNGPLKGALKGLLDGTGDCEELTSLFVALCRASNIPARTVWVPGHCYPEFYLVDGAGQGYWFPCQAAGARAFGGIPEHRPILQKGDNFHDPDRPEKKLRYVSEFLKGSSVTPHSGTGANAPVGRPQVQFLGGEST